MRGFGRGDVEDVALPLYAGKMIYVNNWAAMPVSSDMPGRSDLNPDFLLGTGNLRHDQWEGARVVFRDIARTPRTNVVLFRHFYRACSPVVTKHLSYKCPRMMS